MSVVARQSIKYGIIGYSGTLIGILATLFLYPNDLEFAGKLQFIVPTVLLFMPFVTFGILHANVRFYPIISKTNNEQNLLKFSYLFIVGCYSVILVAFYSFGQFFSSFKNSELWKMSPYIFVVLYFLSGVQLISKYISIKKRIVVPNLLENFLPKLGIVFAFIAYTFLNFKYSLWLYVLIFVVSWIGIILYLNKLEKLNWNYSADFLHENNFKSELFSYTFITFLGSSGSIIALNLDAFIIGEFLSFKDVTVYVTALNLVKMIAIPALGVYTISAPIIAQHIENNEWNLLKEFHHKTSFNLFSIGIVLFSFICVGIEDVFQLMKNGKEYSEGLGVIYIMGIAILFDLATGFNGYIITNSKYYRFNNWITVFLALVTILSNLFFLHFTSLGLIGVAVATASSLTVYNLIKIYFNYVKFRVHPFSTKYLYWLIYFSGVMVVVVIPSFTNPITNLFFRSFLLLFWLVLFNFIFKLINFKKTIKTKLF